MLGPTRLLLGRGVLTTDSSEPTDTRAFYLRCRYPHSRPPPRSLAGLQRGANPPRRCPARRRLRYHRHLSGEHFRCPSSPQPTPRACQFKFAAAPRFRPLACPQFSHPAPPSAPLLQDADWDGRPRGSLRPRDASLPVVSGSAQAVDSAPAPRPEGLALRDANVIRPSGGTAKKAAAPTALRPASDALPDIDGRDKTDPLCAVPFIQHMMSFYKRTEPKVRVSPEYMARQADVNEKMRAILIDWLVDVHLKFKLMPETLFLTVNLIDRFLEAKQVTRKHLQLVGVTAMLVASKYEEIWAPEVRDFVYISDRAYNRDQILNMEKIMLNVLRFNLTVPTHAHFFQRWTKAAGIADDAEAVAYATYLVELALPDYGMLKHTYSKVAAAACAAACAVYGRDPVPRALARHSGYTEATLRETADELGALYRKASTASLTAVYKKYSMEKHHNVANRGAPPRLAEDRMMAEHHA